MSMDALPQLAERAGVSLNWIDYRGVPRQVAAETLQKILNALELPCDSAAQIRDSLARLDAEQASPTLPPLITARVGEMIRLPAPVADQSLPLQMEDGTRIDVRISAGCLQAIEQPGYHRLQLPDRELIIAVAPPRSFGIADIGGSARPRPWGLAAQLYSLRRAGDGGVGDFTALADFARRVAAVGADAVAISPVHALFAADVDRFGPYAPSSRLFLNAMHVDPVEAFGSTAVREVIAQAWLAPELKRLEALPLIDWPGAARVRQKVLRALFMRHSKAGDSALQRDFERYCQAGGETLRDHARFEALHAAQWAADPAAWNWRNWPQALRDPRNPAVAAFAAEHAGEVYFHMFLQWLADRGLAAAQVAAREAGMSIGLIADLAVGTDGGGSHAWSRQRDMLVGLSIGAPPDLLNALGQSWGLAGFSPRALRQHGYGAFLEMLRASLRHAGGLRIDHILGLGRLWLVPEGADATEGAYLRYPLDDLLKLIQLESWRHRAVIVGEDLGTVPDGFREKLDEAGVMGMRVLWFERDHGLFVEPKRWSGTAMATPTTHDLPTIAGWWAGRDIEWRAEVGQLPPDSTEAAEQQERAVDRDKLWAAFEYAGVAGGAMPPSDQADAVIDAALRFVAAAPAPLTIVPVEDIAGLLEQPNLPGTTDQHPNWRRRLPVSAEDLLQQPEAQRRLQSLRETREAT